MIDVGDYVRRAAQRSGYRREYFLERNIPTQPSSVVAIPFYGDLRSSCILSSLVLRQYVESNPDKYFIMCSWPGFQPLFPYVNEFWSIDDESITKSLAIEADNLYNNSRLATELTRGLAESLNIVTSRDLKNFYDNGFTNKYIENFKQIKRYFPEIPSANSVSGFKTQFENRSGTKILVYPVSRMKSWQQGRSKTFPVPKEFWTTMIDRLCKNGYTPVVWQNFFTYDVSRDFAEKCIYFTSKSIADVMAVMRHIGCVLDVHNGVSRLATIARCPYVSATERHSYIKEKDYEVDDICGIGLPRKYLFSISSMLMSGSPADWEVSFIDNIMVALNDFLPQLVKAKLPSTNESYDIISDKQIRERKSRRIGAHFLKMSKNL